MNIKNTEFTMSDYDEAGCFWASIPGVGLDDADTAFMVGGKNDE